MHPLVSCSCFLLLLFLSQSHFFGHPSYTSNVSWKHLRDFSTLLRKTQPSSKFFNRFYLKIFATIINGSPTDCN